MRAATIREAFMAKKNMGLVYRLAHKYARHGIMTFDELVSEGVTPLLQAVQAFDPNRGFTFATYAVPGIGRRMMAALRKRLKDRTHSPQESTPEAAAGDDPAAPALATLPDRTDALLTRECGSTDPDDYLGVLDDLEILVVRWRFGLGDGQPLEWEAIGQKLSQTPAYAKRVYEVALNKMRLAAAERG